LQATPRVSRNGPAPSRVVPRTIPPPMTHTIPLKPKGSEESRWTQILLIAWPLVVANSFWNLQLTIDRIFLGQHSTESLGAAIAVMGVFWVPMALLQGTANYVMTFVAQYYGADEKEKIGACVWQSIYVSVFGGIAFLGLNFLSPFFFTLISN